METFKLQIIETIAIIAGYYLVHYITRRFINHKLKQAQLQRGRRKMIIKSVHIFSFITAIIFLSAIWGLKQHEIAVFVGSIITALGIAFFAQWSLLSNITSSLLLFFNHPMNIGDTVKIHDKDFPLEGEVSDLTYFFVHIKTAEGELVTIPNSLMLQKVVSVIEKKQSDS